MQRQLPANRPTIYAILLLQFIPLLLFPADSFAPSSQEWWLPALFAVLVLIADVQVILRRSTAGWPWTLMSFAQGFNIISRLMLIWPHAQIIVGKAATLNTTYIFLSLLSIFLSGFLLVFIERPDIRMATAAS